MIIVFIRFWFIDSPQYLGNISGGSSRYESLGGCVGFTVDTECMVVDDGFVATLNTQDIDLNNSLFYMYNCGGEGNFTDSVCYFIVIYL
jgi:hypothetical protein